MKIALITGISGQDGSYLADLLLKKDYVVHGIIRRSSSVQHPRLEHLYKDPHESGNRLFLHYGDIADGTTLRRLVTSIAPDEIYHLGAQSHVRVSFDIPEYTADVTGLGTLRLLEAARELGKPVRIYNACSSEMFGNPATFPITEQTPLCPASPYAVAKVFSYWIGVNYRTSYNMYIANGILFNHESPRRGETFVTRKIVRGLHQVQQGKDACLFLGNLDAKRDWGYAPDFVQGMWEMLQLPKPDDFILATGETHSVREFAEHTAPYFGFKIQWEGSGKEEKGIDENSGKVIIRIDQRYFRPSEVYTLLGDASKAQKTFGWKPSVHFDELVRIMAEAEMHDTSSSFFPDEQSLSPPTATCR